MTNNVTRFPTPFERAISAAGMTIDQVNAGLAEYEKGRPERMEVLMAMDVHTLRYMWDNVGDDSFYHSPEGRHDCAEIHATLNAKGDGYYCAV